MTIPERIHPDDDPFSAIEPPSQPEPPPYTISQLFRDYDQEPAPSDTVAAPDSPLHEPAVEFTTEAEEQSRHQHTPNCWPDPGDPQLPPNADLYLTTATLFNRINTTQEVINALQQPSPRPYEHNMALLAKLQMCQHELYQTLHFYEGAPEDHPTIAHAKTREADYDAVQQQAHEIVFQHQRDADRRAHQGGAAGGESHDDQVPHSIAMIFDSFEFHSAAASMEWAQQAMSETEDPNWQAAYQHILFNAYHAARTHYQRFIDNPEYQRLTDHERAQAEQAHVEFERMHERALNRFNDTYPINVSPSIEMTSPEMTQEAHALLIEPIGFDYGVSTIHNPDHQGQEDYMPYLAYFHNGARHVQPLNGHFPLGFDASLAAKYLYQIAEQFTCDDPATQHQVRELASNRCAIAAAGLHCVTHVNINQLVAHARSRGLSDTAIYDVLASLVNNDFEIAHHITEVANLDIPSVTIAQARAVVNAARAAELDESTIANLAAAMYQTDYIALGINPTPVSSRHKRRLIAFADRIGFDERALDTLAEILDQANY